MPRYFFHVQDGSDFIDEEGTELLSASEARIEAVITAGEVLRSLAAKFWKVGHWHMHVVDENGATVCSLHFSAERAGYV